MSFFEIDFQFLLLTIFNLQANILTTKDILSNLGCKQLIRLFGVIDKSDCVIFFFLGGGGLWLVLHVCIEFKANCSYVFTYVHIHIFEYLDIHIYLLICICIYKQQCRNALDDLFCNSGPSKIYIYLNT